jgi:glucose-1-phosphate cytidylyltransferase
MKVVILAGGVGTRLSEETLRIPKPMVEIGGDPILVHIMRIYAQHGLNDFVVACGYLGHVIKAYFASFKLQNTDFTVELGTGELTQLNHSSVDWSVSLIDTGLETMTGGRLARLEPYLGNTTFMATYGDGLADIDISDLLAFHRRHGKLATITAVRPEARFGSLSIGSGGLVTGFEEKVTSSEARINGGFFVLEPKVFGYIDGDAVPFERAPLERLAADNQLVAYPHVGFWKPMDTQRDRQELERLWSQGGAPWSNAIKSADDPV